MVMDGYVVSSVILIGVRSFSIWGGGGKSSEVSFNTLGGGIAKHIRMHEHTYVCTRIDVCTHTYIHMCMHQ